MTFQTINLVLSCVVLVQSISAKSIEISSYSRVAKHGNNVINQTAAENVQVQERMDNFPDRGSESSGRAMPNNGPFPYQLNTNFLTKPINDSPKTAKYIYPSYSPYYPSNNLGMGTTKLSPTATGQIGASDRFAPGEAYSATLYKINKEKKKGYQYPVPAVQLPTPQRPPPAPPTPLLPTIPPPPLNPMPMPSSSDGGGSNSPADSGTTAGSSDDDSIGTIKVGPDTQYLPPDPNTQYLPPDGMMQMPMPSGGDDDMMMPMDDHDHSHDHNHDHSHDHQHYDQDHGFPYFFNGYQDHGPPEIIWDDPHHHHHDEPVTTTTEAPPPPPPDMPRVQKYSYFYIGRKLWYIPLYFTLWFTLYVAALIIRSIARHKVALPNHWQNRKRRSLHDFSHEELIDKVNQNTVFIMNQIEDFKNKYIS